jgi:hypothetical protein
MERLKVKINLQYGERFRQAQKLFYLVERVVNQGQT